MRMPGALNAALPKKSKKFKANMEATAEMMKLWPPMYEPMFSAALPLSFRPKKERKKLKLKHPPSTGLTPLGPGSNVEQELGGPMRFSLMPSAAMPAVPTKEEVCSINKKLMRMDTIIIPSKNHDIVPSPLSAEEKTAQEVGHSPSKPFGAKKRVHQLKQLQSHLLQVDQLELRKKQQQQQSIENPKVPGELPTMPNESMKMFMSRAMAGMPNPPLFSYYPLAPRPGLIPSAHSFLPVMPFPMLKTPPGSKFNASLDFGYSNKHDKLPEVLPLPVSERGYCNIAPLVPESMKLTPPEAGKQKRNNAAGGGDYPRTPKVRESPTMSETSHDFLLKNLESISTPESSTISNSRSLPVTPGGVSLESLSQLSALGKSGTASSGSANVTAPVHDKPSGGLFGHGSLTSLKHSGLQPPLAHPTALNPDDPIEVSDDSVDAPLEPLLPPVATPSIKSKLEGSLLKSRLPSANFMNDIFTPNSSAATPGLKLSGCSELEVNSKDTKKAKKTSKASKNAKHAFSAISTSSFGLPGLDVLGAGKGGVGKLAGGADLIPLASTGFAYSAKTIPANSLTGSLAPQLNMLKKENNAPALGDYPVDLAHVRGAERQLKKKEHKKLKKLKEEKVKRKKDKKDKMRGKELKEKYLLKRERVELPPELFISGGDSSAGGDMQKEIMKKIRKELKKKHKQQQTLMMQNPHSNMKLLNAQSYQLPSNAVPSTRISNAFGSFNNSIEETTSGASTLVPKLTLKLGVSQSPTPPDEQPVVTPSRFPNSGSSKASSCSATHTVVPVMTPERSNSKKRELSPELARISPLVTRPPKQKQSTDTAGANSATASTTAASNLSVSGTEGATQSSNNSGDSNIAAVTNAADNSAECNASANIAPPPSPWLAGGTLAASAVLLPQQLFQSAKTQEQFGTMSEGSATALSNSQASAQRGNDHQTAVSLISETSKPSSYIDAEGNRVWICPACGKVDDGSPMIGCDGCDAWYHWVCVGISVAPKDNEDWFCRVCITRKRGIHGADKKRKRSKKR